MRQMHQVITGPDLDDFSLAKPVATLSSEVTARGAIRINQFRGGFKILVDHNFPKWNPGSRCVFRPLSDGVCPNLHAVIHRLTKLAHECPQFKPDVDRLLESLHLNGSTPRLMIMDEARGVK